MPKKLVRINLDELDPLTIGKVDYAKIDATTEEDIARNIQEDILESRRVAGEATQENRQRMGMSEESSQTRYISQLRL